MSKLMAIKNQISVIKGEPRIGWVFLNIEGDPPISAWECYRGIILPAKCYPHIGIPSLSLWFAYRLRNLNSIETKNEFQLETVRCKYFPRKVSRLTGFFHFSDKEAAERFAEVQSDDDLTHFKLEYLAEVAFDPAVSYSKYDSEWITHHIGSDSPNKSWMMEYWSGRPCPLATNGPIWEMLTYTPAMVYGTELRERAYRRIADECPDSLGMLELSRLAATGGFMAGHSVPYMFIDENNSLKVGFLLRVKEFEDIGFKNYLKGYQGRINIQDLNVRFRTPDFRPHFFQVNASMEDLQSY